MASQGGKVFRVCDARWMVFFWTIPIIFLGSLHSLATLPLVGSAFATLLTLDPLVTFWNHLLPWLGCHNFHYVFVGVSAECRSLWIFYPRICRHWWFCYSICCFRKFFVVSIKPRLLPSRAAFVHSALVKLAPVMCSLGRIRICSLGRISYQHWSQREGSTHTWPEDIILFV